ncbi:hypothetical protein FQA39_LY02840 [Lamprigera yunnana]|nr:hypothetical protein FQA39_LY02840 [Lamprigera yunnana]
MFKGKTSFTQNYFEDILKKVFENVLNITNVNSIEAIRPGNNYTSDILRVFINHSTKDGKDGQVFTVIAKCLKENDLEKSIAKDLKFYENEFNFYEETLPKIYEMGAKEKFGAKLYYMSTIPKPILLIEDLSAIGFELKCRLEGLDLEHCFLALEKLANFHASSVALYEKNPELLLKFDQGLFSRNETIEKFLSVSIKELYSVCQRTPSLRQYYTKLQSIKDIRIQIFNSVKRSTEFNVLNHGDLWSNNMMFCYNSNGLPQDVLFFDYQLSNFTSPVYDLHYFLATSLNAQVKSKYIHTLIDFYVNKLIVALKKFNVNTVPTNERLLKEFKERAFIGFGSLLMCLPLLKASNRSDASFTNYLTVDGEDSYRYHCFNNKCYIEDLEQLLPFYEDLEIFV